MSSVNQEDSFKQHVNSSINIFIVGFIIFILIKIIDFNNITKSPSINQDSFDKRNIIWNALFASVFFIFSLFTNISITENKLICGEKNIKIAFFATFVPFILICILGIFLITVLPGWVRCFSNTFGSACCRVVGFTETILDKVQSVENKFDDSTFLNEIYVDSFHNLQFHEDITRRLSNTQTNDLRNLNNAQHQDIRKEIIRYIYCKDIIGEGLWHFFLGIITLLVSYNTILAENCNAFTVKKDEFRKYLNDKFEKN